MATLPRGSIYTTTMELGSQNHKGDGLLGPNSITVVYMDPLGSSSEIYVFPSPHEVSTEVYNDKHKTSVMVA